jgi:tRNA/tmRNA/rRNA uracil-C5-methylase (TrmA/RlmC/RlmD family)
VRRYGRNVLAEGKYKQEQLLSFLKRQAKQENAESLLLEPFASPKHLNYRNKITLHYDRGHRCRPVLGYFGDDNETVVEVPQCPLAAPEINAELAELREDPRFTRYLGVGGSAIIRYTKKDGVLVLPLSVNHRFIEEDYPMLHEHINAGEILVPPRGFYQVNPYVSPKLVEYVIGLVEQIKPDRLLDMYCGVGVFGLSAAHVGVPAIIGYDSGRDVIGVAQQNAAMLGLNDTKFICGLSAQIADSALRNAKKRGGKATVIVDPPRSGLEPEVTAALWEHPVENLIYVSCSPDTLARDLVKLTSDGTYSIRSVKLFDMFPRTAHFETVCLLSKLNTK